jgi:hypothetical protein
MSTWHAPPELLIRFATEPRSVEPVTASSVEQHLLRCERCRRAIAEATPPEDHAALDIAWAEIIDRVDRRHPSLSERLLIRLHLDPGLARLVTATPTTRLQAVIATLSVSMGAAFISRQVGTDGIFLAIAPLVLLAAVALTFVPGTDPAGEIEGSTPMHGFGLFWRRAVVVMSAALGSLGLATTLLAGTGWSALAWVAPALALALAALALSARHSPSVVAGSLALGWVVLVQLTVLRTREIRLADTMLFAPSSQLLFGALALGCLGLLIRWRDDFDRRCTMASQIGRFR